MGITAAQLQAVVSVSGADKAKSDLQSVGNTVNTTGGFFKNALGGALSLASGVAGQALGFLKNQFEDSIKVAMDHQQVMAQTAQAIRSTKDASGESATAIDNLADSLSHVTDFSHDTIQSGENLLLTFTGIGKKVFPETTKAMLDLSQATGQDMKSSAIQLGKALNDPLTGMSALQRVGVTFSADEQKSIKTMMAHNDVMGAQKVMLHELETEFGGSATAVGKTFAGQVAILKNNFEDLQQKIGTVILPILGQLVSLVTSNVMPVIEQFANYLQSPAFQSFASSVGHNLITTFQNISSFVKSNVIPAIHEFIGVLQSPQFADFINQIGKLGSTLLSILVPSVNDSKSSMNSLFGFIQNTALPALSNLAGALNNTITFLNKNRTAVEIVAGIITTLFIPAIIKSGVESALASVKIGVGYVQSIVKTGVEGWQAAGKLGTFILSMIKSGAEAVASAAKITASFVASMVKSGVEAVANAAKVTASFVASMITAGAEAVANAAKVTASFIATMIATGAQAVITGAQIVASFIAGLISAGAEAIVSAGIMLSTLVPALATVAIEVIAATWPFLLIAAIVAVVVAGIILAVQHWGQISAWLQGVWAAFSGWFGGMMHGLLSVVSGVISNIVSFFQQLPGRAMAAISSLGNSIGGFFTNLAGQALSWGADMISNFASGIANAAGGLIAQAQSIASNIASILHFSKPDRGPLVDADKWMPDMMSLLSSGIEQNMDKIKNSSLKVGATISATMSPLPSRSTSNIAPSGGFASALSSNLKGASVVPATGIGNNTTPIQIIVQPSPVNIDGRTLASNQMPYIVDAIRYNTGIHGR